MYDAVLAQAGLMVKPDIPDPPMRWLVQYFDHGRWDWHWCTTKHSRDERMAQCREYCQAHQLVTIPGVESDE